MSSRQMLGKAGRLLLVLPEIDTLHKHLLRCEYKQPLRIELYSLAADVGEESDVADDYVEVAENEP